MGSFDDYVRAKLATATPDELELHEATASYFEELYEARFGLGDRIAAARTTARLTQAALASLSGVPQAEISRIEHGLSNVTVETLTKLIRPLGLRLSVTAAGPDTAKGAVGGSAASSEARSGSA